MDEKNKSIKLPANYSWDTRGITHDKELLCDYLNRENVIYDKTLTENASTIIVDNLDIFADCGKYEFELISNTDSNNEVRMLINGLTSGYYQSSLRISDNINSSHEIVPKGYYAKDTDKIDGWMLTANSLFPQITKGFIWMTKNILNEYKVSYSVEHFCSLDTQHCQVNIRGVMVQNMTNVTSLTFKLANAGNYLVGTRLKIKKVK